MPDYPLENPAHERLRQAVSWARTFSNNARLELIGEPNDHLKAANQLMVLLAMLARGE